MRVAILALQGAFIEHEKMLARLGVETFEVRQLRDWEQPKDGLIIPGGESTVQIKLLRDLGLYAHVAEAIKNGLPVFGTCAGLIMLAKTQDGEPANRLSTMDIDVRRNAYGRQLGSFYTEAHFEGVGDDVPMTFIRAPYINGVSADAKTLAMVGGHIVAARQGAQLVTAFHPELNDDTRIHEYFIDMIRQSKSDM
ncbi:pyridoxal 5'-phosphate synthase glutaminase subunit PdxT [uncultured Prevotella sp.]|uniref:pyridoxal 5'-phosphate synthase glutaminase subunit PdxT n=1 Tax=uncultured Prevotella sp. TaxID=159272 RepID=UPI0025D54974|nr:pyridoxal 5'-phosphate synthase glutaminase subunit PdxT [uncultured Prevotella sp.]